MKACPHLKRVCYCYGCTLASTVCQNNGRSLLHRAQQHGCSVLEHMHSCSHSTSTQSRLAEASHTGICMISLLRNGRQSDGPLLKEKHLEHCRREKSGLSHEINPLCFDMDHCSLC